MKKLYKSILAGICIGIAARVYVAVPTNWIAACLFSIGLIIILTQCYSLFTGVVGFVHKHDIPQLFVTILGNALGVWLMTLDLNPVCVDMVNTKLQTPLWMVLIRAIGCGLLMQIAVSIYKDRNSVLGAITCVPGFILAGFEHSIADMFYVLASHTYTVGSLVFILVVIVGNSIGAQLNRLLK